MAKKTFVFVIVTGISEIFDFTKENNLFLRLLGSQNGLKMSSAELEL